MESGETVKAIQEITEMIKYNYTVVENDFQSIYNLHEVLISMALPLIPSIQNKSLSLDQVNSLMEAPAQSDEAALFPAFTPTEDFIKQLNASFQHYANSFVGVKSVNALNCRKSALLSQMLLRHKLLALQGLESSKAQTGPLFSDLIVKYSQIFLTLQTLVFDLAPYLGYLPECGSDAASQLITMFDTEVGQVDGQFGADEIRRARIILNKTKMERMLGRI